MFVNGIKCDTCDQICNVNPDREGLPEQWIDMRLHGKDTLHFCSLECLRLWIPKHPVASEFVGVDDEPKITLSDRVY